VSAPVSQACVECVFLRVVIDLRARKHNTAYAGLGFYENKQEVSVNILASCN